MPRPRRTIRTARHASPFCEHLEPRLALSATVINQILVIEGSPTADTIGIDPGSANGSVILSGVPGVPNGTEFTNIRGLRVDLKSGNDTFSLTGSILTPDGQPASLLVLAGNGQDTLSSSMAVGSPEFRGGNSHDTLSGGPASDLLKGGRGIDSLFGNAGEDRLEGQLGRDFLAGGPDNDSLFGGFQADTLYGNDGNDLLDGGRHADNLFGGIGADSLFGRQNPDFFHGAPSECDDFQLGDQRFNVLFNPATTGAIPGITYWNRFAAGEDPLTQRIPDSAVAASNIFAAAFAASTPFFIEARDSLETLDPASRNAFLTDTLAITNAYSPSVLANPSAFSRSILEDLGADLTAAAPAGPFAPLYSTWIDVFIGSLADQGYVDAIRILPANQAATQSHLFAADAVFNADDWH